MSTLLAKGGLNQALPGLAEKLETQASIRKNNVQGINFMGPTFCRLLHYKPQYRLYQDPAKR